MVDIFQMERVDVEVVVVLTRTTAQSSSTLIPSVASSSPFAAAVVPNVVVELVLAPSRLTLSVFVSLSCDGMNHTELVTMVQGLMTHLGQARSERDKWRR